MADLANLRALAAQYYRAGNWKRRTRKCGEGIVKRVRAPKCTASRRVNPGGPAHSGG